MESVDMEGNMCRFSSTLKSKRCMRTQTHKAITNPLDSLPDFSNFTYQIAVQPANNRLRAWGKLQECERRLEMYKWVEKLNNPSRAQHRILLNDMVSAFLLSFEATVQFTKDQWKPSPSKTPFTSFKRWLEGQSDYDIAVRGIRTLRHFEAHKELKPPTSMIVAVIGSEPEVTRKWQLPELQQTELRKLDSPQLEQSHLADWNKLVTTSNAGTVLTRALRNLKLILDTAEAQL
jgi:hypothetical protein